MSVYFFVLSHKYTFLKPFLYSFEDKFFLLSKISGRNLAKRVESISILE